MEASAPLRKPLALVFCDISGFTRLMAREGDLVAFTVIREFREHTGRLGKEHHGLMIKFIADGFLAAFENVDDVMPLLISVENLLSENPRFVGRSLGFKFSLHYGSAVYIQTSYGSDVLGDAVNVAARLSEIAQPNEVVVSQAALERMPSDYRARAGASERREFKGAGDVEFRRLSLLES